MVNHYKITAQCTRLYGCLVLWPTLISLGGRLPVLRANDRQTHLSLLINIRMIYLSFKCDLWGGEQISVCVCVCVQSFDTVIWEIFRGWFILMVHVHNDNYYIWNFFNTVLLEWQIGAAWNPQKFSMWNYSYTNKTWKYTCYITHQQTTIMKGVKHTPELLYVSNTFGGLNGYSAGKMISILKAPQLKGGLSWGEKKKRE